VNLKLKRLVDLASSLDGSTSVSLNPRQVTWIRVGWLVVFALTIGLFSAIIPMQYEYLATFSDPRLDPATVRANLKANGISTHVYATYLLSLRLVFVTVWTAVGAIIFWRRSDDWFAVFTSLSLIIFAAFTMDPESTLSVEPSSAMWAPVHLLGYFGSVSLVLFFFLFPDGRFAPRWTRWIVILWAAYMIPYCFFPDSLLNIYSSLPFANFVIITTIACIIVASQLYRYRRISGPVERQQTKWVVFGTSAAMIGTVGFALPFYNSPTIAQYGSPYALAVAAGVNGTLLLVPLSIGVATLRYRLWDIDVVVNRTLVYLILSASVVVSYVLIVTSLGTLLGGHARGNFLISLLTVGLIAVLFAPMRERLQRGVNRLMYGERDEPYLVLSHLGQRLEATLEPKAVLPTIVDTVAGALKLPYAAIAMKHVDGFKVAAAHGSPTGEEINLPLNYAGETVGRLVLSPRAPGEKFSPADRRLLEDLGRQAEVAVQAVRLTADLQRSRERLVSAREEERRRLRRDLHDGLGPTLATLSLGLDVSLKMLDNDPQEVESLLRQLKTETQDAVVDIRRLVYGLRPPALDDLGLVPAIREQASKNGYLADDFDHGEGGTTGNEYGLLFFVEAPEALPPLSAAVEVACYRIAQEAITNVARHSRAKTCRVRLSVDRGAGMLEVEITDDGVGMPEDRVAGVGLSSMRERAEELGGTLAVEPRRESGTRVLARLPLLAPGEQAEGATSSSWRAPSASS
jgi:signal transduction histidine kinase